MTKNQKTYSLLVVVLAIWGILGFKVINGLGTPEQEVISQEIDKPFIVQNFTEKEQIEIAANYRDPFLGTQPKSEKPKNIVKKKVKKPKPPKKNISFSGSVAQNNSGERLFFVSINGQQHIMEKRQKIDEVTLLHGNSSSIKVAYPGHTETIHLQK